MKPDVKEFYDEATLNDEIMALLDQHYTKKDLFVMTYDDERTKRIAHKNDVRKVRPLEESLGYFFANIFKNKENESYQRFEEFGFTEEDVQQFEEKLTNGIILLIIRDV